MEGEGELLDLSHLSEAEQASILEVLLRDSELRCRDEGRVRTLQQKESDPVRLRSLSGAWFNEERNKRHRDTKDGVEIVQASLRRRKPRIDVALSGVFNGQTEEAPPMTKKDPTSQMKDQEEDQRSNRSQNRLTPTPRPRTRSPNTQSPQDSNSHSSSSEYYSRRNGHGDEREETLQDSDEDWDSMSSGMTEQDPNTLRHGSSISSLKSNNTLSGSMMSLFSSGEFGAVEVKGRILFSLDYDTQKEELHVMVSRCEDLAAARKNRSDPYVKAYLLPDKSSHSKKKTSVKKKTLSPVFDQTLKYKISVSEMRGRTLNLSVWHAAPLGRNLFLGEVELELATWDWTHTHPDWYQLVPRVQCNQDSISSRGIMVLSIKFTPAGSEGAGLPLTGELHIWLREAVGLLSTKGGAIDSFVKSFVLPDASRSSSQKTRVVRRTLSPTYNHTMVYDGFQPADLKEACAELTVWHREGLKTHLLGGVRLSPGTGLSYGQPVCWMDSTEEEVAVWTSMMQKPNQWIDTTLRIRTNLVQRPE
ncbi:synaptotagmin-like protein 1 isoform X2 [Esox lucius]|nr:synaptotagmin-like protein 1 isoform X2 [Esox lucius]XP_010871551.2 synaptotagmin-like protein 1 isoform X2 [Esox lucius]XP_010871552.2 synaptotagmin-like protein 1 isoform X2 [Esox lucius]